MAQHVLTHSGCKKTLLLLNPTLTIEKKKYFWLILIEYLKTNHLRAVS